MPKLKPLKARYPSISECYKYADDFGMYNNIRAHSRQVARVALAISDGLKRFGKTKVLPNRRMTVAGALMHDIAKTKCIENDCRHGIEGQIICEELGYPEIGHIVIQHIILKPFQEEEYKRGHFEPATIVHYADKRVLHDQIVSIDERLSYITERYGRNDPDIISGIAKNFQACQQLEDHLFSYLDFSPQQLNKFTRKVSLKKLYK